MLKVCLQQSWPQDKPIAQIVFPQLLPSSFGNLATLWVMLPKQEIQNYLFNKPNRQFLFMELPYPMLLWITAFHSQDYRSRWLPCYLDLKEPKSYNIAECLAKTGYYRLLLFSSEEPQRCTQVMTVTFSTDQCQRLQQWIKTGQTLQPTASPNVSRDLLKSQFEKLKFQQQVKLDLNKMAVSMGSIPFL